MKKEFGFLKKKESRRRMEETTAEKRNDHFTELTDK
jgi:hypothetical protein